MDSSMLSIARIMQQWENSNKTEPTTDLSELLELARRPGATLEELTTALEEAVQMHSQKEQNEATAILENPRYAEFAADPAALECIDHITDGDMSQVAECCKDPQFWSQFEEPQDAVLEGEDWEASEWNLAGTHLRSESYFSVEPASGAQHRAARIHRAVEKLRREGMPPGMVWMLDDPWQLLLAAWDGLESVMGGEICLEPSVTAFRLEQNKGNATGGYIGCNFGLPHRDFTHQESVVAETGEPSILIVWIPVSDSTLDNGCIALVPKSFDAGFTGEENTENHMRPAEQAAAASDTTVRFPLASVRQVPAKAGSVLGWQGCTIHWGTACSPHAEQPRVSLGCVVRRRGAVVDEAQHGLEPIPREMVVSCCSLLVWLRVGCLQVAELGVEQKLQMVCKSLGLYRCWYPVEKSDLQTLCQY